MLELSKPSVTIRRVLSTDAKRGTDIVGVLTRHLAEHTPYYPAIGRWIEDKVIPGISSGQRIGYVGFQEDEPVLAAILKQGESSKFCHLSINEGFQGNHLGQLMFSLMAAEIRSIASEVHFTLPESLWAREPMARFSLSRYLTWVLVMRSTRPAALRRQMGSRPITSPGGTVPSGRRFFTTVIRH